MSKLLTPQETFQAIADDKALEYKWYDSDKWERFNVLENSVFIKSVLTGRFFFRLAQEMITVGDISFPKPESETLSRNTKYYLPYLLKPNEPHGASWENTEMDYKYLKLGLIHLSQENAIAHAKAIIKLSAGITND